MMCLVDGEADEGKTDRMPTSGILEAALESRQAGHQTARQKFVGGSVAGKGPLRALHKTPDRRADETASQRFHRLEGTTVPG